MRELDSGGGTLIGDEARDAGERLDVGVRPYAHVLRRDATPRLDSRGLDHHEPRSTDRARAEVNEVPVVRQTVPAAVLAHRGDADPVAERDPAQREGIEEREHSESLSGPGGDESAVLPDARAPCYAATLPSPIR